MNKTIPVEIVLTDTHLFEKKSKQDSIMDCNFDIVFSCFEQAIELAKIHNLSRVIHAGDFFDSRKNQSKSLLEMSDKILDLFHKNTIKLIIIHGNHDLTCYDDNYSFISPFRHHPGVELINQYKFIDSDDKAYRLHFIPFFNDDIYINEFQKTKILENAKNILITHIGIKGVLKNDGEKETSTIALDLFNKFDKVLIGHFHNTSTHNKGKIVYIGSALQHNFGEDNKKGIVILNSDLTLHRERTKFKEYQTSEVDVSQLTKEDLKDLIELQNDSYQRLILTGDEVLLKTFDKSKLEEVGIKINIKPIKLELNKIEERLESHDSESILINFNQFCIENSYDENEGLVYLKQVI